ncbi:MAG TPA: hypothetical protein VF678_14705 [bacterium]
MTRKLLFALAVLVLLCATGAVQAIPSDAMTATQALAAHKGGATHTRTFTRKAKWQVRDGKTHAAKTVTGIRTANGVWEGYDQVVETISTQPEVQPATADAGKPWIRLGYVEDHATWTGAPTYNYEFNLKASVGWQSFDTIGHWSPNGPYQYRENPSCFKYPRSNPSNVVGTSCNFSFYGSFLGAKHCAASDSCTVNQPWGQRDFYQNSAVSILFQGDWHYAALTNSGTDSYGVGDSLQSCTYEARARFLDNLHLTNTYTAGSAWVEIAFYPGDFFTYVDSFCGGLHSY